jgi:hypothetical protein
MDIEARHTIAYAIWSFVEALSEGSEIRKDVLGLPHYRQFRLNRSDVELTLDVLCHGPLAEVIPELQARHESEMFGEMERLAHRLEVTTHSPDCTICRRTGNIANLALSNNSFKRIENRIDRPAKPQYLSWRNFVMCAVDAGYNYKARCFKAFGRELLRVDQSYNSQRSLSRNQNMYLSDLACDLRNVLQLHNHETEFSNLATTDTIVGRIVLNKTHDGRVARWKKVPILPISQYVGIAVLQPVRSGNNGALDARDFYDWRDTQYQDTPDNVVAKRTTKWKGICTACWVQTYRDDSLSSALVSSGAPDPLIRLHSDYYEDLLDAVEKAEAQKKLRIFIVEPLTKYRDRPIDRQRGD